MSSPANRWKLGLFVVLAIVVCIAGLTWLGMARLQRATHEAWAFFDEPLVGLETGSMVRFRGLPIGVVADVKVAIDKKHVQVHCRLYDDKMLDLGLDPTRLEAGGTLPDDLRMQIVTSYLTQTSFLLVDFFADAPTRALPFETPPNTIQTVRSTFRNVEEGLRDVLRELPELTAEARRLLTAARTDLAGMKLPELSRRADSLLATAEARVAELEKLPVMQAATSAFTEIEAVGKLWRAEDGPVRKVLGELSVLATDLRAALAAADLAATSKSLRAAGDGTAAAGREVAALGADLRGDLANVRSVLAAVERLVELLERDPGALLHGRVPPSSPLKNK